MCESYCEIVENEGEGGEFQVFPPNSFISNDIYSSLTLRRKTKESKQ